MPADQGAPSGRGYQPYASSTYRASSLGGGSYLSLSSSSYLAPPSALAASTYLSTRDPGHTHHRGSYRSLVLDPASRGQYQSSLSSSRSSLLSDYGHRSYPLPTSSRSALGGYSSYRPLVTESPRSSSHSLTSSSHLLHTTSSATASSSGQQQLGQSFEFSRPINAAEVRRRLEREREARRRTLPK